MIGRKTRNSSTRPTHSRQPDPPRSLEGHYTEQDKDYPHRRWAEQEDWKNQIHRRGVHKALDIADEMEFQQQIDNSKRSGMGWKEMAVLAAALLGGGGMLAYFNQDETPAPQQTQQSPFEGPYDSEYEVIFYDSDGNVIKVPHISERPTE